ncbi:MAG TPA: hypothetical protein VMV49_15970 [Candidatus Deferrimicrobium sp.]|nr:hypothetical protein [Candidatus Deferrimicrobium sp.]
MDGLDVPENQDFVEVLATIIKELLETQNINLLFGVQSLSSYTEYTLLQTIENIINTIFILTLKKRFEAKSLRADLDTNRIQYERTGRVGEIEDRIKKAEEGKISIMTIRSACGSLKKIFEKLLTLKDYGFLEIIHNKGDSPFSAFVRLTPIWDNFLDQIQAKGIEHEIFGSALGKMIALGIEKKGISALIPLIFGILIASNNGGELLLEDLRAEFTHRGFPYYRFSTAIERNNVKDADIRMIVKKDGNKIIFSPHVQNFIQLWNERALIRMRARQQSRQQKRSTN